MGRFGPVTYKFYAPDNLSTPLNVGGVTTKTPVDGAASEFYSAEGRGSVTFVNDTALNTLAAVGNIAYATYTDAVRDDLPSGMVFSEPFVIRSRRTIPGTDLIVIEGPDLLTDLKRFTIYRPLGLETIVNTTLTAAVRAPFNTTLLYGAPRNNKSMSPTDSDSGDPGREVRVTLDNGNTFVSTILERLYWNSRWYYDLRDRYPSNAAAGNAVQVRDRRIQVDASASFAEGVEVHLTTTGGTFITLVDEAPDGDIVTLRDGIPYSAVNGAAVTSKDYSQKTTNDVTQVMAFAAGWSTEFETGTGTAAGTRYGGGGDTVYDILRTISDETGEYFRIKSAEASPAGPKRTVRWNRSYIGAGVGVAGIVRLVEPTQGTMVTESAAKNRAILLGRPEHEGQYDPVTQVIPVPSDPRITLFGCSATALAAATAAGFSVVTTGLGLYAPPYVVNDSLQASLGTSQRRVTFSEVTVEGDNAVSLTEAADKMLKLSIDYLKAHVTTAKSIRVSCVSPIGIRPGDLVELYYVPPTGEYTLDYTGANALVVMEVTRRVSDKGELAGVVITDLVLSPSPQPHATGGQEIGRRLKAVERAMVQIGTPRPAMTAVSVGTGGGTGGSIPAPPTDHGSLAGLADDDHTQYWNDTRGDAKIATHTSDADAHHALVTNYDTSMGVIGQAIYVTPATNSGLITSAGLKISLRTNSGLSLDSAGVGLGTPGSVSAVSTNLLSGSNHYHAVVSTSEGAVSASTLLATSATNRLSLGRLGIGVQTTSLDNTALLSYSGAATNVGLKVQAHSTQTANLMEVTSYGGSPYLRITGDGNMESGAPGFVSGRTGWQIAKDGTAEFNNVWVRGELHAVVFTADEVNAAGGSLMVATASTVAPQSGGSDNVLPATNGSFTLNATASWVTGGNYFPVGSVIRIKTIKIGSGIDVYDIYAEVTAVGVQTGRVTSPAAGQQANAGYYPLTCTRRYGGATGYQIPDGSAIVLWTVAEASPSGYEGNVHITASGSYAPYIDVATIAHVAQTSWGATPTTTPRLRLGNLDGVLGLTEQWGLAAGTDLSDATAAARYIVASDQQMSLHNVDLDIYNGASQTVDINSNGNVKFGTNVSSGTTTTFSFESTGGTLRVGRSSGPSMYWDGTNFTVRNSSNAAVIQLDSSGNSSFEGVMKLGSGGGIYQGDGTFASPGTGLKIWRDGTMGRLATYSSGVAQVYFDTSGKLTAGAGAIYLDADGLTVESDSSTSSAPTQLKFKVPGGGVFGKIVGYQTGLDRTVLISNTSSARTSYMDLFTASSNHFARLASGSVTLTISGEASTTTLANSNLFVSDGGVSAGYPFAANQGQFVSDIETSDWNSVVLLATTEVAHGMTDVVSTNAYGTMGKVIDANGGLSVAGYSEDNIGANFRGYVVNEVTTTATTSRAAVMIEASLKSGTTVTTLGTTGNLLAVRNNGTTRFIIKGNGNYHYDGTGAAYDDYDDIRLLRAADLSLAGRLDQQWERWLGYNRPAIEEAGIVTFNDDGGHMVNGARLDRLLAGTLWQLHERLERLEEQLA